jgi:UDP-3-O-[3-hydroxymyristoyl] glucosamine N-acyltransferase
VFSADILCCAYVPHIGAVIENNVSIDHAVICDGVTIGAGAVIPRGCVLSYGVRIGPGAVLQEFTRVARRDAIDEVPRSLC